ncbi:MAG: peptidoglycan editing factor PgeF [Hyphomonadaceae bacterium]|nr:peptidoglycan editing factor PgeF [Hyphomonadaceae bacterium]
MSPPPFQTAAILQGQPGLAHGFFGRAGGVSTGIYASLNVGIGSGDDAGLVEENRGRVRGALGLASMVSCYQVHRRDVVEVTAPWAKRPEADAMVTCAPGIGLCILTADCVPVLFADIEAGVIGAAHAGWKGALAGVCASTVSAMEDLGARADRIKAAIGPAIQQTSYEVGPEFRARFLAENPGNSAWFVPGTGDRWQFDLTGYVRAQLVDLGLAQVACLPHDTCADPAWFSNRRRTHAGEPDYGRNASVIGLLPR